MTEQEGEKILDPYAEFHSGHGVAEEDRMLARKDKNAVEFAFNYSKAWCKFCKDLVFSLEKRAQYESDYMRNIGKQFQNLENILNSSTGAPMVNECLNMSRIIVEQCKDLEQNNSKRYRELTEVINRQRTEFARTRKFLKDKWKSDVKRMVDSESALAKTRSSYFQKCQTGSKLREDLAQAQTLLNDLQNQETTAAGLFPNSSTSVPVSIAPDSNSSQGNEDAPSADIAALTNQITKQRSKVDSLEKKLADNDKKEMELMYAFRESVESANKRMVELEKSKVEILCDTRLTVSKCDQVMRDSMSEIFEHLFNSRKNIIEQFSLLATDFRDYEPCSQYLNLVAAHTDQKPDIAIEKYHFEGYHELVNSGQISAKPEGALGGRFAFVSRFGSAYGAESSRGDTAGKHLHSDSESDDDNVVGNLAGSGRTTMFNSIVEFGSNLFRPDSKKVSVRSKQRPASSGIGSPSALELEAAENMLAKEFTLNSVIVAYCITGIESQAEGLLTHGIYRVPASKSKVASVCDQVNAFTAELPSFLSEDDLDLSSEHPLTLASVIKARLLNLSEPLFTYSLYNAFLDCGKGIEGLEVNSPAYEQMVARLTSIFEGMRPEFRRFSGLLFHHLYRIARHESANQMGAANLGTMFGPTLMRQKPKFQVANMMDFVDNKAQTKVVEVIIEEVSKIFHPAKDFSPSTVLQQIQHELANPPPKISSASVDEVAVSSIFSEFPDEICSRLEHNAVGLDIWPQQSACQESDSIGRGTQAEQSGPITAKKGVFGGIYAEPATQKQLFQPAKLPTMPISRILAGIKFARVSPR
ncbi:Rho GTPase-activating protein 29 [Cichlidogyrus casuarinus]|uniref:Rho GTPase-activating protein 29 n=1 Tax=Cichlidogyrus casuarinus TaxID=1844966 RepID=A0ABD2Q3H8_9PLAT